MGYRKISYAEQLIFIFKYLRRNRNAKSTGSTHKRSSIVRAFHKPQIVKRLRSPRSCDTIKVNRKNVVAEATLFMPEVNSWCEDENCASRIEDSDLNDSPREVFLCHMHRLNNKSIPCRKIVLKKSPIILTLYCSGRG